MVMGKFEFAVPFGKAERDGEWYLTALATGTEVDKQNERMAPEAIVGLATQIERDNIPFLNWHNANDALAEMGEVTKAWLSEDFHMGVEIRLDQEDNRAQRLWNRLDRVNPRTGKPYEYGLSIGGSVNNFKDEYEKSIGRNVRTYYDVQLEEISLTTKPIYTPSLGTVFRKAADAVNEGDKTSMSDVTPKVEVTTTLTDESVKTANESLPSDQQVSEPETTVVEVKQVEVDVEKAASARTKEDAHKLKRLVGMHREMSTLIAELVLSADDDETKTPNSNSTPSEIVAVKAEETKPADDRLEKALSEIDELKGQVNQLRESTPAGGGPGLLVRKSDEEELAEMLKSMTPTDKLRFALRAKYEGK